MDKQNFAVAPDLKPEDKKLLERIKEKDSHGGSLNYSAQGAENYVKAVQQGKIDEVLKKLLNK